MRSDSRFGTAIVMKVYSLQSAARVISISCSSLAIFAIIEITAHANCTERADRTAGARTYLVLVLFMPYAYIYATRRTRPVVQYLVLQYSTNGSRLRRTEFNNLRYGIWHLAIWRMVPGTSTSSTWYKYVISNRSTCRSNLTSLDILHIGQNGCGICSVETPVGFDFFLLVQFLINTTKVEVSFESPDEDLFIYAIIIDIYLSPFIRPSLICVAPILSNSRRYCTGLVRSI